ncbi:PEP-CTERM sorting domain-containing protein [Coraliomargarita algicola]|uniref:PEP-CTERM sorting domain-containing protein n=1 Tax=Coraliomargarita algicola TaxID=3092156 RepID=A0ABZ0RMG8_9BACT|nr:PEP-CTERM sorting domain-containing protein [Coraliomargarita sp. J2-16]WPJ96429.1 PEP-CTERM sorting domain-containing protein [Coraliomargarita sp. J2-16]
MNTTALRALQITGLLSVASSTMTAAEEYTETFTVAASSSFSAVGWNVYLLADNGDVNDLSTSSGEPAEIFLTDYAYIRTAITGYSTQDGPGLMFTTEPTTELVTTSLSSISKLSVGVRADSTDGAPATGRFAIQIGSQWYVSSLSISQTTHFGPPSSTNPATDFPTFETPNLFDFTDGNNWHELTVITGAGGEISIAASTAGGTLSGDVTAFGVYAENGNNGDHFRIDNFTVVVPEPSTFILPSIIGIGLMMRRRRN